jgi:ATP/maltotriose-dependent transcriptional regulator MalT
MPEMGADYLRFTLDEAADLLKNLKSPEISVKDIRALN